MHQTTCQDTDNHEDYLNNIVILDHVELELGVELHLKEALHSRDGNEIASKEVKK